MLTKLYLNLTMPMTNISAEDPGIPNPAPEAPQELKEKVDSLLGFGMYIVMAACVAGILIVAGRMAIMHRRGELGEHMGGLVAVATACILGGAGAAFVKFFWV